MVRYGMKHDIVNNDLLINLKIIE